MIAPKKISTSTALQARGLFALGASHYKMASECEKALSRLLDLGDERYCGRLSDAMIDGDSGFDPALRDAGFVVEKLKRKINK